MASFKAQSDEFKAQLSEMEGIGGKSISFAGGASNGPRVIENGYRFGNFNLEKRRLDKSIVLATQEALPPARLLLLALVFRGADAEALLNARDALDARANNVRVYLQRGCIYLATTEYAELPDDDNELVRVEANPTLYYADMAHRNALSDSQASHVQWLRNFMGEIGVSVEPLGAEEPQREIHRVVSHQDPGADPDSDPSDVEVESDEQPIIEPYNPTDNRIDSDTLSLDRLINRLKHNEIDLAPDFQRAGNLWSDATMSRLIESILIRLPLPAFYFDGTNDDKWLVVDGLQRLSTLQRFVNEQSLRLTDLEYLGDGMNGKLYSELPRAMQRRIQEAQITAHVIRPGTPNAVKYDIFRRINTGGLVLTSQEIRHALNPGRVLKLLKTLATSDAFVRATGGSISPRRMLDREFVLRFCAFRLTPYSQYAAGSIDRFLTDTMGQLNSDEMTKRHYAALVISFQGAMRTANAIFGDYAFRKRFSLAQTRRNPINKALFEVWSVTLGRLKEDQRKVLVENAELVQRRSIELMNDDDFVRAISQGTGDVHKVRLRFSRVKALISDILEEQGR